jgi:hypothetical protein
MRRRKKTPVDKEARAVIKTIENWYSFTIPIDDAVVVVNKLLESDREYWEDEFRDKSYEDTSPREQIVEMLTKTFLYMVWPVNGDSQAYKDEFYKTLTKVGKERNWKAAF